MPTPSWRIQILPFLGEQALYDQYDFAEPWNGPNNHKLADQMPGCFQCPANVSDEMLTSYKLVTGPGSLLEGSQSTELDRIFDGTSGTIALLEDFADPIPWMSPEDISIDDAVELVQNSTWDNAAHKNESNFARNYAASVTLYKSGSLTSGSTGDADIRLAFGIDDGHNEFGDRSMNGMKAVIYGKTAVTGVYFFLLFCVFCWATGPVMLE